MSKRTVGFSQRFIPMNETRSPSMAESLKGGGGGSISKDGNGYQITQATVTDT
jgi:hypothetical protein